MAKIHNLGYQRIGQNRELKFALETYWRGDSGLEQLQQQAATIRRENWLQQQSLDLVPVADFSLYDQVLDTSVLLGNLPKRANSHASDKTDRYFLAARGRASKLSCCGKTDAGEMTKWFDTNYHYIVPEFDAETTFSLNPQQLLAQLAEATALKLPVKPVIIGPLTYLWLGKSKDDSNKLALLERLLPVYQQLLEQLAEQGVEWLQLDEPALVTELNSEWQQAYRTAYQQLGNGPLKILLATYFGELKENLPLVSELPVAGVHLDAVRARNEVQPLIEQLPADRFISLGVIDGRNIWKTDLNTLLDWLLPISASLGERLWLAPSCSLLHVPLDLESESAEQLSIFPWLAFARQKLNELALLGQAINFGRDSVQQALAQYAADILSRQNSDKVHNPAVREALSQLSDNSGNRQSDYPLRAERQKEWLKLPLYPTTTIGSFPQTSAIRNSRRRYRNGDLSEAEYQQTMEAEIQLCIQRQEELGLDVLVHGEPERNDMVEYFGQQLEGYAFSQFGWVQSYGSRCVKPPILFGDISRPEPITVDWARYAQSLTSKPVKGMLTGPVTMLNWSFVRDDQPRSESCRQLALAIRHEVLDLEQAGIRVIQIDEAALREGLPLRSSEWQHYLDWTVEAFRITANGVEDETQIHTHMCYSEFNDIIADIARMDADVITIETSRSDMELLDTFDHFNYPNEIGPGVYDIHSPNIPGQESIIKLMQKAAQRIPPERLWINPDCGLKTRQWDEVIPALQQMTAAASWLRKNA